MVTQGIEPSGWLHPTGQRGRAARVTSSAQPTHEVGAGSVLLAATASLPVWATAAVLAQAAVTLAMGAGKRAALVRTTR